MTSRNKPFVKKQAEKKPLPCRYAGFPIWPHVLNCCEVKLTSETPHPEHQCMDSFPVSSHLKLEEHCLPSPLVSDSYCSLAANKSAALGCLLKGGSGSKVKEACPLAPSHQMAPQDFSGCQECTHSLPLHLLPATPLYSNWCCHPMSPPPLLFFSLTTAPIFSSHP